MFFDLPLLFLVKQPKTLLHLFFVCTMQHYVEVAEILLEAYFAIMVFVHYLEHAVAQEAKAVNTEDA